MKASSFKGVAIMLALLIVAAGVSAQTWTQNKYCPA